MEENKNDLNMQEMEEGYYGVGSFLWEIAKVFFWALIIIMPIRVFLFQPFFVQGSSMEPNYENGDYLIVNELGYKKTSVDFDNIHFFTVDAFKDIHRGDVVVFRYPKDPGQFFIKRIIGLPGETVKVEGGKTIIVNKQNPQGFTLNESQYLPTDSVTNGAVEKTLANDEYFTMGDNRQFSHDSRAWGALNKDKIIGKVLLRAWPVSKFNIY